METSAPGEAGPPKQKKRKKSQPASLVETSPALPPGWDLVRTCSSGEILFLHLESLQCQRERPRQSEEDQHSDKEEQGGQEETLSKAGADSSKFQFPVPVPVLTLDRMACRFSEDNSVTQGDETPGKW